MKVKLKKRVINRRPKRGDIVYWSNTANRNECDVLWGMVDAVYSDAVIVDHLEIKETRLILPLWGTEPIPLDSFSDNRFHKLPKGWTYSTRLFDVKEEPFSKKDEDLMEYFSIYNPQCIKKVYDAGLLVKAEKKFHGSIRSIVTKEGYKIVKENPMYERVSVNASVPPSKVKFDYFEAEQEYFEALAELNRQAALSDYEWSKEHIDKNIERFAALCGYDMQSPEVEEARAFFEGLTEKEIENAETRISGGHLQYKQVDRRKWATIV